MKRRPPVSTRTYTLFPYTTLFRSCGVGDDQQADGRRHPLHPARARPPDGGIAPEEAAGYRLAACQVVGRIGKLDEGRGFGHHIFVLAPEERPILMVLGEIGLDDQRPGHDTPGDEAERSEEHTSELQSLMRISYAVFCLKNKNSFFHF